MCLFPRASGTDHPDRACGMRGEIRVFQNMETGAEGFLAGICAAFVHCNALCKRNVPGDHVLPELSGCEYVLDVPGISGVYAEQRSKGRDEVGVL